VDQNHNPASANTVDDAIFNKRSAVSVVLPCSSNTVGNAREPRTSIEQVINLFHRRHFDIGNLGY